MDKAKRKYKQFSKLYYIASFLQTFIIAVFLFIIFSKAYIYIKDIIYNESALMLGMYLLPYLPVIVITLLTLLLCVMLVSLVTLVTPLIFNDLCKERSLLFSKFSVFYSFGIYVLINFFEKTVSGYAFVFAFQKMNIEFIAFFFIHLILFVILCVTSHKSKSINENLAKTVRFNVR